MKKINKVLMTLFAVLFLSGFISPVSVFAATAPSLGAADGYSVYGDAGVTNSGAGTHAWGNVGDNNLGHAGLIGSQVDGTIDAGAGVNAAAATAYGLLAAQGATASLNLAGNNTVVPGVYTVGATTLNGTLTLSGAGVYIFRSDSSISTSGPAVVNLTNGASACNVFWQIPTSMTIGGGTVMVGTIITDTGLISLGTNASLKGRALAHTQVTLLSNLITEPTCTASAYLTGGATNNTITVFKQVINDNGGTASYTDFPLFVNGNPVVSGASTPFAPGTYTVSETNRAGYTSTFTGNCDANGVISHGGIGTHNDICTVVNNDIGTPVPVVPPLIDVVKVPSPLALPAGPGAVTYTYTVKNIGTVPMTDVTLVGDTCSPILLNSGDTNNDFKLDLTETWVYHCSTNLSATHTNTVVATGWANGINAVDVASATVIVGASVVPPLIHITKVPNPLVLSSGAGYVTYTKKVTNPGTVALSSVKVTDDKCSSIKYISGDTNNDSKLDVTETWTYTCRTRLTKTTTNTAIATGTANGLIATDFALATVVVSTPTLPRTGFTPQEKNSLWNTIIQKFSSFFF